MLESPRVTKPYTEEQWAEVLALGDAGGQPTAGRRRAPHDGRRADVRRRRDRDAAEWNTDALGPTKRGYATELVHKLRARVRRRRLPAFRPGQVVSGRAAAALGAVDLYWRADGQPLWSDPALFADEREPGQLHASEDAKRFITHAGDAARPRPTLHPAAATRTSSTTSGASGGCR